ncbi:uncharacterized protein VTP21DRAFT_9482 [Calcarisporiella thermophila]|uniref:uncharacterized protein n=1 Tax=Calcarisporiella thermophila TaxID=911321 RepID=UPI00374318ED
MTALETTIPNLLSPSEMSFPDSLGGSTTEVVNLEEFDPKEIHSEFPTTPISPIAAAKDIHEISTLSPRSPHPVSSQPVDPDNLETTVDVEDDQDAFADEEDNTSQDLDIQIVYQELSLPLFTPNMHGMEGVADEQESEQLLRCSIKEAIRYLKHKFIPDAHQREELYAYLDIPSMELTFVEGHPDSLNFEFVTIMDLYAELLESDIRDFVGPLVIRLQMRPKPFSQLRKLKNIVHQGGNQGNPIVLDDFSDEDDGKVKSRVMEGAGASGRSADGDTSSLHRSSVGDILRHDHNFTISNSAASKTTAESASTHTISVSPSKRTEANESPATMKQNTYDTEFEQNQPSSAGSRLEPDSGHSRKSADPLDEEVLCADIDFSDLDVQDLKRRQDDFFEGVLPSDNEDSPHKRSRLE